MFNILLFVNPVSGKGKSVSVFKKAHKILQQNNFISIHITTKQTNILKLLKHTYNLQNYDLIVGVGGDGMMYDIINAIHKLNLQIPIAQIPTGSGNGYFKSLTYQTAQNYSIETAIDIINRHNRFMMTDLMHITNEKTKLNIYGKLSISWGLISCVDIYTEWMRKIGDFRFTLGAIWNILKKINYKGELTYKHNDEWLTIKSNEFIYFWACNTTHPSHDSLISPSIKLDDGLIEINYILGPISRCELIVIFLALSSGSNHPKIGRIQTSEFRLTTQNGLIVVDGEQIKEKKINVINLQKQSKIIV